MTGRMLGGYRIAQKLGAGGMGVVYAAQDTRLNRQVAIKVLGPHALDDPEQKQRLIREARTASALNHPNIVTIYEIDSVDGMDFIVMEHIKGKSLESLIGRKGLAMADLLRWAIQISEALSAAHSAGVLHRDLKPGNVMITDQGLVKLLDFGLAKLVEAENPGDTATRTLVSAPLTGVNAFPGTVDYMSPEQAEGKRLDARSDIFSFGALLYEMATGLRPFHGRTSLSTLSAILRDDPKPISSSVSAMAPELDRIVRRCLRKDPARRYQHIEQVGVELMELQDELHSERRQGRPTAPKAGGRRAWVIAAAALLPLLAGLAGWAIGRTRGSNGFAPGLIRRMTYDKGLTHQPALSPDGTLLAYASDRAGAGNLDIWVQQVGASEPLQATRGDADESEPSFSPSGTSIAFRSQRDGGGVYVMSTLGGEPRLVAKHGRNPTFSPDGQWIAWWVGEPHLITTAGNLIVTPTGKRRAADFVARMYVAPAAGGNARSVLPDVGAAGPVWLRDSKHLLFLSGEDFLVTSIDGSTPVKTGIVEMLRQKRLRTSGIKGMWTMDGDDLILSAESGEVANLYRIHISPRTFQAEGELRQLTAGTTLQVSPAAATRGRLAFASPSVSTHLWSAPVETRAGGQAGPMQPLTEGDTSDMLPALSRDGNHVVFRRSRAGGFDLWHKDLAQGRAKPLTSGANVTGPMALSPDGREVAYIALEEGKPSLYIVDMRAPAPRRICEGCLSPNSTLSWHSGGRKLIYASPETESWILRDLDTGATSVVLRTSGAPGADLRLSPDNRWAVFHTIIDTVRRQIFVVPIRTGAVAERPEWIPITDGTAMDRVASWSGDGSLLYFQSDRDGSRCIWGQRLDPATKRPSGAAWPLIHFHSARNSLMLLSSPTPLAAAGNRLVFSLAEITGDVWMMDPSKD